MLKTRVITAIVLAAIFICAIFYLPPLFWNLLVLKVVCLGAWEWSDLAKFSKSKNKLCGNHSAVGIVFIFGLPSRH